FDFAPNRGKDAIGWTECYPGDDVVDIVGMDSPAPPPAPFAPDQTGGFRPPAGSGRSRTDNGGITADDALEQKPPSAPGRPPRFTVRSPSAVDGFT
ncbi:hypothetical protein ACWC98_38270, partial [Streptomyces goshikiensis]